MKIGYIRTSTKDKQTIDMQMDALLAAGVAEDDIYIDKGFSGSKTSRPALDKMMEFVRKGDTVYFYKLDRISRSTKHLLEISESFEKKGVDFVSIHDKIDTSTPMGKFYFTLIAAVAELERGITRDRVMSGLESSRARGVVGGRPKVNEEKLQEAFKMYKGGSSIKEIKLATGIAKATFYKYLDERKIKRKAHS